MMGLSEPALLGSAAAIAGTAAVWDARTGFIPNRLLVAGSVIALVLRLGIATFDPAGRIAGTLLVAGLGALAAGVLPLALYARSALAAGDVKLLMVCGVCLGPVRGFEASLYAFAIGGAYGLARLSVQARKPAPFRFGPAICCGVVTSIVQSIL